jgi:hypothetical protein
MQNSAVGLLPPNMCLPTLFLLRLKCLIPSQVFIYLCIYLFIYAFSLLSFSLYK